MHTYFMNLLTQNYAFTLQEKNGGIFINKLKSFISNIFVYDLK